MKIRILLAAKNETDFVQNFVASISSPFAFPRKLEKNKRHQNVNTYVVTTSVRFRFFVRKRGKRNFVCIRVDLDLSSLHFVRKPEIQTFKKIETKPCRHEAIFCSMHTWNICQVYHIRSQQCINKATIPYFTIDFMLSSFESDTMSTWQKIEQFNSFRWQRNKGQPTDLNVNFRGKKKSILGSHERRKKSEFPFRQNHDPYRNSQMGRNSSEARIRAHFFVLPSKPKNYPRSKCEDFIFLAGRTRKRIEASSSDKITVRETGVSYLKLGKFTRWPYHDRDGGLIQKLQRD